MKRLALVLAAALLGTGCIDNTCDRVVSFDWSNGFRNADGALVGCSSASGAVSVVDVWVNGQLAGRFFCSDGSGSVAMPAGTSTVDVEGVEDPNGSNTIIFRDTLAVNAGCGSQIVLAEPAEGRVNLDYTAQSTPACANGPCFVWFSVTDDITGQIAAIVNATSVPTSFPYPDNLVFRLPVGSYTVDFVDVVSGGLAELTSCTTPTFSVSAGTTPGEQQLVPAAPVLVKTSCP